MAKRPLESTRCSKRTKKRTITILSCSDGRMTQRIEILRKLMDGQRYDISCCATWHQRNQCENTILLYPMVMISKLDRCERAEFFKSTTQNLTVLRQEQGRQKVYILKNKRARQRPFDEALRADLEWHSQHWKTHCSHSSSSSSPQQWWHGNTNTKTLNGEINIGGRVMATDSFKAIQIFHRFRAQTLANVVHATESEDRPLRRTHIFLSVAHLFTDQHTHLRVAQVWDVLHLCAFLQVIHSQHVLSTTP